MRILRTRRPSKSAERVGERQDDRRDRASAGHHRACGPDISAGRGKVVERGVHEELLAADGHYAALWRSQQVDALEKALLVEGAAMRGAAAGPQEADGEAEPNGADSRESEER